MASLTASVNYNYKPLTVFEKPPKYIIQQNLCLSSCMCTAFPFAETLSNGKVFGLLTSGVFPHDRHSPGRDTENSYIFVNDATFAFGACGLSAHTAPIKMVIATHVEQTICTDPSPSIIKVQISPLVRAYLWQIFAGLASIAIALKTLFERRARVCLKSNP